jgi:hypothetical protein
MRRGQSAQGFWTSWRWSSSAPLSKRYRTICGVIRLCSQHEASDLCIEGVAGKEKSGLSQIPAYVTFRAARTGVLVSSRKDRLSFLMCASSLLTLRRPLSVENTHPHCLLAAINLTAFSKYGKNFIGASLIGKCPKPFMTSNSTRSPFLPALISSNVLRLISGVQL